MGKFISNLFLGALALGLSIFTGSRTLDLLAWALPAGQIVYQWLGLAAFELGMYFWSFYFINGAKGTPQRSISVIMAVFSIVAVAIATVADLSLDAGQSGKVAPLSPSMQQAMIIFLGVTISLNVAAFLACKLLSIDNLRSIKEGQAEDLIYDQGLRAVSALAPSIAADAAPHLAADWSNRVWQKIVPGVQRQTQFLGPAPSQAQALPAPAPVPAAAPAPAQPAPVAPTGPVVPSQAPARRKLLGFIPLGGGSGAPAPASFAQTGTLPAQPAPAPAQPAAAPAPVAPPVDPAVAADAARRSERDWAYVNGGAARERAAAARPRHHRRPAHKLHRPAPSQAPTNGGADAAAGPFPGGTGA